MVLSTFIVNGNSQWIIEEFIPGMEITAASQKIEQFVDEWGFGCDKLGHGVGHSYADVPYITAASD